MSEDSVEKLGQLEVLIIFDWRDGPLEGIVRRRDGNACWYFKLIAERLETSILDDRLFGLWVIPDSDSSILCEEFGGAGQGAHVWPVSGGLGSIEVRSIVDGILSARAGSPNLIIRTPDFVEVFGVWNVVPD
ncbi:hypothetical protein GCM10009555_036530 [Acrocarpospora macrocephala]|uniref:Uncharacterized protein n=1 Tax=Acrocarpospora macrocephala TaxID=150177 RepID=A0A5M3WWB2_9ACTN|nr:hypothetical protein [Acrocarpospora macrocephala]GES13214.1 hypothetical protein Amac_068110 [Acrocarpospora macrocephala]